MEHISKLASLSIIFTVYKLLDFISQAIEGPSCLPGCHHVIDDHLKSLPLLMCSLQILPAHVHPESTLDLCRLLVD